MHEQLDAGQYPSLSVGIVYDQKLLFAKAYGFADLQANRPATPETIYRIGSVTKVFTTTLMCVLRDKGVVRLDDPVSNYLPADVRLPSDPRGVPAITLRHLATHSSGLPRVPMNVVAKGDDAYGGYTARQMYEALGQTQLIFPTGAGCEYSNWGVGLLGHVLARAGGETYETLLKKHVCEPLGMTNTTITLGDRQRVIYALGYKAEDTKNEMADWDLGVLAGCGSIASNVPDLAKFVSLQLRAGQADVQPIRGSTLVELQTPQRVEDSWESAIALGWIVYPNKPHGPLVWHNGETGGHHAFVAFVPRQKFGVIVLTNCDKDIDGIGVWLLETVQESLQERIPTRAEMPTAEQILDRSTEATGGVKAYDSLRTLVSRGKGTYMGMPITYEEYIQAPDRCYTRMEAAGLGAIECGMTGQTVWQTALGQAKILTGDEREISLRSMRLEGASHWREQYTSAELQEVVDFEGHRCYKLALIPAAGPQETQYIAIKDYLPVGCEFTLNDPAMGATLVRQVYEDYQPCGPILRPRAAKTSMPGVATIYSVQIEGTTVNADIPAERFNPPPAIRNLLAESPATRPAETQPTEATAKAEQTQAWRSSTRGTVLPASGWM